jgi:NADPH:quinone reductase-like Zn-dependent oxidoreductase
MKAIVYTEYGKPDVLHLQQVAKPTPKDNELLIRVYATTVNIGDLMARNFSAITPAKFTMPTALWLPARLYFGWSKPKVNILGNEFSGIVESVGSAVTRFKPGDPVFGYRGQKMGAYAEYLTIPENGLVAPKPSNMTFEQAATVPGGAITALSLLRSANIQPGQRVLVNGASGSIGSAAVQLAKQYGAHVAGVCGTLRIEYVKSIGADEVIDYTKQDFTENGETYDVIFDILGKSSYDKLKDSLTLNGIYLLASFKMKQVFQMLRTRGSAGKRVICALSSEKQEDLQFIQQLAEQGKFKSAPDRCYPLEQAAQAHEYMESGQRRGPVVLAVASGSPQ